MNKIDKYFKIEKANVESHPQTIHDSGLFGNDYQFIVLFASVSHHIMFEWTQF